MKLLYLLPLVFCLACDNSNSPLPLVKELPKDIGALEEMLQSEQENRIKLVVYSKLAKAIKKDNPDQAMAYLEQQLQLARETDNIEYEARAHHSKGFIYQSRKKYDKAIYHYLKAIALFDEGDHTGRMADDYFNIGTVFLKIGIYEEAIPYFEKAVQYYEQVGDTQYTAITFANLAMCHWKKGSPENSIALEYYGKAIGIELKSGSRDSHHLFNWQNDMGALLFRMGNYHEAINAYDKALKYVRSIDRSDNLKAMAYANIAEATMYQGEEYYQKAEVWIHKVIALEGTSYSDANIHLKILNIQGELAHRLGKYSLAMGIYEKAVAMADTGNISEALTETLALWDRSQRAYSKSGGFVRDVDIWRVKDLQQRQKELKQDFGKGLDQGKLRAVLAKTIDNHHNEVRMTLISAKQSLRMQVFLCVALLLLLMLAVVAVRSRVRKNELDRFIMENWKAAARVRKFRKERGLD